MFLPSLTEHQIRIFGGILVLAVLVFGLLGLLLYLDKRGVKTGAGERQQPKKPNRKERRANEQPAGGKNQRPRIKKK